MKALRIGAGAGFAGDRIEPAVELASLGDLDYLVFECLAERTIALAQLSKRQRRTPGFDPLLRERMEAVLPLCRKSGTRIVSNMGAANPRAAAKETARIARELGLQGLRVAAVTGDDVLGEARRKIGRENDGKGHERLVSANAYLGADALLEALNSGADVVLTGRVADPSLFLAPMISEFGWALDDWNRLGQGTAVGHLLECAGQLTGGYFADPGYKDVPHLDTLGFPMADVHEDGEAALAKLESSGGALTIRTCKEQILYEVHDPARYLTPDVTADFTGIRFQETAPDRIRICGARGTARPEELKVSTGFYEGFIAEGQISYAGPGALSRAHLARDVLAKRLNWIPSADLQISFIGVNAMHGEALSEPDPEPYEVRLRAAARRLSEPQARKLMQEVESLYVNGPAGGGGASTSFRENIAMDSMLLPRSSIKASTTYEVA